MLGAPAGAQFWVFCREEGIWWPSSVCGIHQAPNARMACVQLYDRQDPHRHVDTTNRTECLPLEFSSSRARDPRVQRAVAVAKLDRRSRAAAGADASVSSSSTAAFQATPPLAAPAASRGPTPESNERASVAGSEVHAQINTQALAECLSAMASEDREAILALLASDGFDASDVVAAPQVLPSRRSSEQSTRSTTTIGNGTGKRGRGEPAADRVDHGLVSRNASNTSSNADGASGAPLQQASSGGVPARRAGRSTATARPGVAPLPAEPAPTIATLPSAASRSLSSLVAPAPPTPVDATSASAAAVMSAIVETIASAARSDDDRAGGAEGGDGAIDADVLRTFHDRMVSDNTLPPWAPRPASDAAHAAPAAPSATRNNADAGGQAFSIPPRLNPTLVFRSVLGGVGVVGSAATTSIEISAADRSLLLEDGDAGPSPFRVVAVAMNDAGDSIPWMEEVPLDDGAPISMHVFAGPASVENSQGSLVSVSAASSPFASLRVPRNWQLPKTSNSDRPQASLTVVTLDVTSLFLATMRRSAVRASPESAAPGPASRRQRVEQPSTPVAVAVGVVFTGAAALEDAELWVGNVVFVLAKARSVGEAVASVVSADLSGATATARSQALATGGRGVGPVGRSAGGDAAVSAHRLSVSLVCPLSLRLMSVPCRGRQCEHAQCVDLSCFLEACCTSHVWQCPVCALPMPPEAVWVDKALLEVLRLVEAKRASGEELQAVALDSDTGWYHPLWRQCRSRGGDIDVDDD